jgi:hypothetical protein
LRNFASSFARFAVSALGFYRKGRKEIAKDRQVNCIGTTVCATDTCIENAVVSLAGIQGTAISKAFPGHHRFEGT